MSLICPGKTCVFKSRLKRSDLTAGSRSESGSEVQTVGLTTEKARGCQMCCDETAEYSVFDGYPNGDVGGRKLRRLARIRRRGTLKLGTEDIEEQSRQAVGYCTRCDITPAIRRPCSLTPWPHYKNRQKHGSMESASCHSPFIRCIPRGALRTSQRKQPIVHKTITALKCLVY